jgi:actin-related protein 2
MQVERIQTELCFVAGDFKREMRLAAETTAHVVSYQFSDGREIKIGSERFQACEVLFQPDLFGIDGSSGLAQEVSCLSRTLRYCKTQQT